VVVAARNKAKGLSAVKEIQDSIKGTANSAVEFIQLDLASLNSVEHFVKIFKAKQLPLHMLINNAGVMACPFSLTADGIETQFGVNHVGHFYLTKLLLDLLVKSAPSRVINLSSAASFIPEFFGGSKVDFEDVHKENERKYDPWLEYGRSKLANVLFTNELAERMADKQVFVNCLHPGGVATELSRHVAEPASTMSSVFQSVVEPLLLKPLGGALTSLYVATHPDIEKKNIRSQYFVPIALNHPQAKMAGNLTLQKQLWEVSEKLVARN
jgi:NAD(P)-dependent dehydrogenase (short-subunit alcohol dehydrogenase family)